MTYASEVLADAPWGWWRLTENPGGASANLDSSGNGRTMSLSGAWTPAVTGPVDKAVTFGSSAGQGSSDAALTRPTIGTWEAFILVPSNPSVALPICVVTPLSGGNGMSPGLLLNTNGSVAFSVYTGSTVNVTSGVLAAGWHHVVGTVGPAGQFLYVDGAQVATGPTAAGLNIGDSVRVAIHYANLSTNVGAVSIAEPAFYPTQLSAARVSAHFAASTTPRVSRLASEVLVDNAPDRRVSRLAADLLMSLTPDARLSRLATEALLANTPDRRVSRLPVEVLYAWDPNYAAQGGRTSESDAATPGELQGVNVLDGGKIAESDTVSPGEPKNLEIVYAADGAAEEQDTVSAGLPDSPIFMTFQTAVETNLAYAVAPHVTVYLRLGQAVETDTARGIDPVAATVVALGQAVETDTANTVIARVNKVLVPLGRAIETDTAAPIGPNRSVLVLGRAIETSLAQSITRGATSVPTIVAGKSSVVEVTAGGGLSATQGVLVLGLADIQVEQAPTALVVQVSEGLPEVEMVFFIDGHEVYRTEADTRGMVWLTSIPVPEVYGARGPHLLTVTQEGSGSSSTVFNIAHTPALSPITRGLDEAPVFIPSSLRANGVRSWVLQDLMPGGLGSWIMPINPSEMDNPSFERVLATRHSTAVHGQWHVWESIQKPLDWSFKGYSPNQDFYDRLKAYGDLPRRFYLIDHRGRAWITAFTQVEMVPRLRQTDIYGNPSDWVHDYTVTALIYNQEPVQL